MLLGCSLGHSAVVLIYCHETIIRSYFFSHIYSALTLFFLYTSYYVMKLFLHLSKRHAFPITKLSYASHYIQNILSWKANKIALNNDGDFVNL